MLSSMRKIVFVGVVYGKSWLTRWSNTVMASKPITFVTGNAKKLAEVQALLGKGFPFAVTNRSIDLPELQGEPEDVAVRESAAMVPLLGGELLTWVYLVLAGEV